MHSYPRRLSWLVALLFACLCSPSVFSAQVPATQETPQRKTSTPYTGDLTIFDSPDRAQKLHIDKVMDLLGVAPGKNVADIGAGSGWFTVQAARRVANTGSVYAVDINPEAVRYIKNRATKEHLTNVIAVLGKADNAPLPADHIDSVLLLKTYHEVADPVALLRNLHASLRPGALVGVIDRNGNGEDHGVQKEVVLREAERAGYRLAAEHDQLVKDDRMDYFLIFVAK